ncbi:MAG: accessory Sec system glycosylation chaperone GtfB [Pseudobutyrivibrio sp.]|nr:accessory Sec system glycosylation chaperone GtfB [Pseudobutyrivibrio sp.]
MEKLDRTGITLLMDYFNRGSMDLFDSFKNAGIKVNALVINDDGFLPDEVINVFEFFLGDYRKCDKCPGKPLYFNQIKVPDYWEISANNTNGSIHDKEKERGRIFFAAPTHKRYVKVVDYLDESGNVRCSEHYNKYGALYARTTFNKNSQKVNKTYFDTEGRETIVENFITSDIILNYHGKTLIFKNRTQFVCYLIRLMGLEENRLFFNSLSVPFFVSNTLRAKGNGKEDVLFWQEKPREEIPGNMQLIFDGKAKGCEKVIVQNRLAFKKLLKLGAPPEKLSQTGFIYTFNKENRGRPEALICTNSENVEKLKEIVEGLPQVKFHVTAITEMSAKLLAHEKYENVIMYPNIKAPTLERLFEQCDFYLDINHEGEIVEATRQAFIHNLLILSFRETMHGTYTADENLYNSDEFEDLINRVKYLIKDNNSLTEAIRSQQKEGLTTSTKEYNEICAH